MKNAVLLFLLSCFVFGCKNNSEITLKVKDAEKLLLSENPDSAFVILKSITNPDVLDNKTFSRWCLTCAAACEKLEEDMPFVPQMERANEYYEKHGSLDEKIMILMYLGMSYEEETDFEWAMKSYLQVVEMAKEEEQYLLLIGKLYNKMACLYSFDNDYDKAQYFYQLSGESYLKGSDSLNYIYSIRDIGWIYTLKKEYVAASESFLKAYKFALNLNDSLLLSSLTNRLGINYKEMNNYSLAEEYLLQSIVYDKAGSAPTFLALADLYTSGKEYKKAQDYINMATRLSSDNQMFKGGLLYRLYVLEKELGNYDLSLNYYEQYTSFADSISNLQERTNILKVEKRYEYEHLLNENNKLDIKNQWIVILCCCLVILCLLLIVLYRYRITKKEKYIIKQQQIIQDKHSLLMEKEIDMKGLSSIVMEIRENVLTSTDVYKRIIEISQSIEKAKKYPLTDKEWITLKECVKSTYVLFFENLQKNFPNMTEEDIRFCCLLKIGLNSQQLAILLKIQSTSVSRRRSRIMIKGGFENTNTTLEKIIEKL